MATNVQEFGTERRNIVTVNVESGPWGTLGNLGQWDARTGGTAGGDMTKIRPAGMGELAIGGVKTAEDVTCWRYFNRARDGAILAALMAARQRAFSSASQEATDRHELPTGFQVTWNGVLDSVQIHDADASSADDAKVTIVISVNSDVAVTA
jgi:hypothetical protein